MTQANLSTERGHGGHHDDEHGNEPHVLPIRVYLAVWAALVVLTVLTVTASRFDFGSANTFIALVIATIKGSLVALFFMHLYYDNKLNLIVLVASLMFVSIFFTPTLIDLGTRGAIDPIKGQHYYKISKAAPVPMPVAPVAPPTTPAPTQQAPAQPAPAQPAPTQPAPAQPAPTQQAPAQPAAPAPVPAHPGSAPVHPPAPSSPSQQHP
jgi:cytochrome c oxidase subunit 4